MQKALEHKKHNLLIGAFICSSLFYLAIVISRPVKKEWSVQISSPIHILHPKGDNLEAISWKKDSAAVIEISQSGKILKESSIPLDKEENLDTEKKESIALGNFLLSVDDLGRLQVSTNDGKVANNSLQFPFPARWIFTSSKKFFAVSLAGNILYTDNLALLEYLQYWINPQKINSDLLKEKESDVIWRSLKGFDWDIPLSFLKDHNNNRIFVGDNQGKITALHF